ncbi:hypothetical protein A2819_01675 [Candidatus Azambacteria bacterium RIFCSPHIGHO2_01_FULL_40_24]|uniref:Mur ligase central domain-containing protein n=1 Tax=Candidatus Azambacteria bacterium RIFCSPHIGHO2_01_FULL_40_24 TaxID=1797301 RepID=A0A1F5B327_9BACT|nr:MAG: hypothetical protein A2819_01675 [Candidatus Azambacteria bacterium RIFCSPHIGHO2_01_FULL_40_24]
MMSLRNLLYLLQLEEYDLKRFSDWLKNNPGRVVLEKKKHINWTTKAAILFALANIFSIITLGNKPLAIKISSRFLLPIDILAKKILVFIARLKINRMKNLTAIGITGSYGKTTTKDAISHVLIQKYKTLKTEGNYNTLLGVTKTILNNLRPEHEIFICEMAAYQTGDIKVITKLIGPKIGIVTAIGPMHLERFGSEENILKTKMELIESLPPDGIGFLPKELEQKIKNFNIESKIEFFSSKEELLTKIGKIFEMPEEEVLDYLKTAPQTLHRQQIIKTSAGITIIDDTYNSNPAGFLSALEMLKNTPAQRKILVTPGMIELGNRQFELNKEAARSAAQIADYVIIVGETNKKALKEGLREELNFSSRTSGLEDNYADKEYNKRIFEVIDLEAAKSKLSELAIPNSTVLLENDLPDHYF